MTKTDKKILIAIPSMDYVASGFAGSLATLGKVGDCKISFICSSLVYDARNKLAAQAIELDTDYILWLDSDMTFKPDTLVRLLKDAEEHDLDIVSGLYFRRAHPYTPVAFEKFDIDDEGAKFEHYNGELSGLHKVEGVGFGCLLMDTQVVFDVFGKYGDCFSPIAKVGEDLSVLWKARQLGYETWLDCDIKCGHVGHVVVTQGFYEAVSDGGES